MHRRLLATTLAIGCCVACGSDDRIRFTGGPRSADEGHAPSSEGAPPAPSGIDATQPEGSPPGTDTTGDDASTGCPEPIWFDEGLLWRGIRVRPLIDSAAGQQTFRGDLAGEPATLVLDVTLAEANEHVGEPDFATDTITVCGVVKVPVQLAVTITPDDPGRAALSLTPSDAHLYVEDDGVGWLDFSFAPVSPAPSELPSPSSLARVGYSYPTDPFATHALTALSIEASLPERMGPFYASRPERAQRQPPPDCLTAPEAVGRTAFASVEEASAAVVGRWAICTYDPSGPDFAGVEIFPDGTWSAIVDDGGLQHRAGFEREGVARIVGASAPGGPYELQLSEQNAVWGAWATEIEFSASGAGFGGLDFHLFSRLDRPVAPLAPPAFARGQRAGRAACASSEGGLEPFAGSESELQGNLEGSWVGCTGYLGQIHFDGGNVEFSETPTHAAHTEAYEVVETHGTSATLRVQGEPWQVVRSTSPVKLWVRRFEAYATPGYDPEVIVFSAL
jgi:hypothetical protein